MFQPGRRECAPFSIEDKRLAYATELLDYPLGRACRPGIYTVCGNPGNVQEPANGLAKVAYDK